MEVLPESGICLTPPYKTRCGFAKAAKGDGHSLALTSEGRTSTWDAVFETNVRGPFLVAREALAHLRAAHGRVVNIGSLGGSHAWAGHAHYSASKVTLHMLTQAMAKAFAAEVSVNCMAPGWIEMDEQAAHFAAKTPMRRNGTAEEIAEAVLFFSAGSKVVTGQILTVDGGLGL